MVYLDRDPLRIYSRLSTAVDFHSIGVPTPESARPGLGLKNYRSTRLGGRPTGSPPGALKFISQSISRVLDGMRKNPIRIRDGHSSWTPVTRRLQQPTRTADPDIDLSIGRACARPKLVPSLFGLAPGGVYHAAGVAVGAVRSYRTFSPLPRDTHRAAAVCSLWHFP